MPEQTTLKRARKARREGKAPTTQAGEFVRIRDCVLVTAAAIDRP